MFQIVANLEKKVNPIFKIFILSYFILFVLVWLQNRPIMHIASLFVKSNKTLTKLQNTYYDQKHKIQCTESI